jgi:aryl sulfotransferase
VQQIVSQLLFNGAEDIEVAEMSPWLDLRIPPKEIKLPMVEQQQHRRFIKTHLLVDALVFSPKAKYIYIGRDGRDVVWSMYNHHVNGNALFYQALNDTPGLVGPPLEKPTGDIVQYFRDWLDKDGFPFWPFWDNIRSWWNIKDLPNVHLLDFGKLNNEHYVIVTGYNEDKEEVIVLDPIDGPNRKASANQTDDTADQHLLEKEPDEIRS